MSYDIRLGHGCADDHLHQLDREIDAKLSLWRIEPQAVINPPPGSI